MASAAQLKESLQPPFCVLSHCLPFGADGLRDLNVTLSSLDFTGWRHETVANLDSWERNELLYSFQKESIEHSGRGSKTDELSIGVEGALLEQVRRCNRSD